MKKAESYAVSWRVPFSTRFAVYLTVVFYKLYAQILRMLDFELHRCSYEHRNHPTMKWTVDTDYHPYVAGNRIGLKNSGARPKSNAPKFLSSVL